MTQGPELFAIRPDQIAGDGCVLALDMSTIRGLYALKFDGVDDYVRVPDSPSLNPSNAITIELFLKPSFVESPGDMYTPVKKTPDWASGYGFQIAEHGRWIRLYLAFTDGTALGPYHSVSPSLLDSWSHLVATFDNTYGINYFLDGKLIGTYSGGVGKEIKATTTALGIGTVYYRFKGLIAEVRIYNRALSADELKHNMSHHNAPITDGLVLWLPFDEGSGTTVADKSGKGNDGTIYGAVWEKQALEDLSGYGNNGTHYGPVETGGKHLRALSFDGVDDYIEVPYDSSLDFSVGSVEAWIYFEDVIGGKRITDIGRRTPANVGGFILWLHSDRRVGFYIYDGGWYDSGHAWITRRAWTHVLGTYDGNTIALYMNGELASATSHAGSINPVVVNFLAGYSNPDKGYLKGRIDAVKVYNKALSADEVKARYRGARLLPQRMLTKLR